MDESVLKVAGGFNGGIGSSHLGPCGALAGGILLIGAIHGRSSPKEDLQKCNRVALKYFKQFTSLYQCSQCQQVKEQIKIIEGSDSCRPMLRKAARLLLQVISED